MKKAGHKHLKTGRQLEQALLELLEIKDYADITVKELCEKAGVNRSTFYLHYETIRDLLTETIAGITEKFRNSFRSEELQGVDFGNSRVTEPFPVIGDQLLPYLKFVKANQAVVRAAFKNPDYLKMDVWMEFVRSQVLEKILEEQEVPAEERGYWKDFYIYGTQAIIQGWLKAGCPETVEELEQIIRRCVGQNSKMIIKKSDF